MYSRTTCEFGDKVFCSSCQRRVLVSFKSKDPATFLKNHKYQCTSYLFHRNQIYKAVNTKCNKRHQCLSVFCCTSYSLLCIFDFGAINKKYIEIDDCFFKNVTGSLLFKDTRTRLCQLEQYTSSPSSQVVLEYLEGAPFPFWFFSRWSWIKQSNSTIEETSRANRRLVSYRIVFNWCSSFIHRR